MKPGLLTMFIYLVVPGIGRLSAQSPVTITNGDGTQLTTRYCYADTAHEIAGHPAGGVFSGCGIFLQNGRWYLNPVTAAAGVSVFPYACTIAYTAGGQSTSRSMLVYKPVKIDPPLKDIATCDGHFLLDAHTLYAGAYRYRWTPEALVSAPDTNYTAGYIAGTQSLVITAEDLTSGCIGSDTVVVTRSPRPDVKASPENTMVRARSAVQLNATGAVNYTWAPSEWLDNAAIANPVATPHTTVTYMVTGSNEQGCTDTASITITLADRLFVPGAFSPNGDGLNDVFRIENFGYQKIEHFGIYNRWGAMVFTTRDGMAGWNGLINGRPAEVGTYYYLIRIINDDGKKTTMKGTVQLLR